LYLFLRYVRRAGEIDVCASIAHMIRRDDVNPLYTCSHPWNCPAIPLAGTARVSAPRRKEVHRARLWGGYSALHCQAWSKKSGFSYADFCFFGSLRKGQWRLSIHLFHDNYH